MLEIFYVENIAVCDSQAVIGESFWQISHE